MSDALQRYIRESYAREKDPESEELIRRRREEFDMWLESRDSSLLADDERIARYLSMVSVLGYQSALTVVGAMTSLINSENLARLHTKIGCISDPPQFSDSQKESSDGPFICDYCGDDIAGLETVHNVGTSMHVIIACSKCAEEEPT